MLSSQSDWSSPLSYRVEVATVLKTKFVMKAQTILTFKNIEIILNFEKLQ